MPCKVLTLLSRRLRSGRKVSACRGVGWFPSPGNAAWRYSPGLLCHIYLPVFSQPAERAVSAWKARIRSGCIPGLISARYRAKKQMSPGSWILCQNSSQGSSAVQWDPSPDGSVCPPVRTGGWNRIFYPENGRWSCGHVQGRTSA